MSTDHDGQPRERPASNFGPSCMKSTFGLALMLPSLVLIGGLLAWKVLGGSDFHAHGIELVILVMLLCGSLGVLAAVFIVANIDSDEFSQASLRARWLRLPRTRHYLERREAGENVTLFTEHQIAALRRVNRVSMAIVVAILVVSTVSEVAGAVESVTLNAFPEAGALVLIPIAAWASTRLLKRMVQTSARERRRRRSTDRSNW